MQDSSLTLEGLITTAADKRCFFFFLYFLEKIIPDISCESSAREMIHTKFQALFSLKNKINDMSSRSRVI